MPWTPYSSKIVSLLLLLGARAWVSQVSLSIGSEGFVAGVEVTGFMHKKTLVNKHEK